MANINTISCLAKKANTGRENCPVHLRFEGAIEVPTSKRFTENEIKALGTTLRAGVKDADPLLRFYVMPPFEDCEVTGGDPVKVDFASGRSVTTFENPYMVNIKYYAGGFPLNDALRTRNGSDVAFLFFGGGLIFGSMINGQYAGVPANNFWAAAQGIRSFKTENDYRIMANINTGNLNGGSVGAGVWYVEDDFGIADLKGLVSVPQAVVSSPAISGGGVVEVTLKSTGWGTDIATAFVTQLTGLNWTAKNKATGAAVTVSSKTITTGNSTTLGKVAITLDTADTDYPASGGVVTLVGPTITALDAAGIVGYEIISVDVTRP